MPKDEREELTDILKGVKSALDEERAGRRKLEIEVSELRKMLNPDTIPDTEIPAPLAPDPGSDIREVAEYIRGQKTAEEEKQKRKKERYKLSTPEQDESEADEIWQNILESAEKEVE